MEITLKIFLGIIAMLGIFLDVFTVRELFRWFKTETAMTASLMEKFLVNILGFASIILITSVVIFFIILLFAKISIAF